MLFFNEHYQYNSICLKVLFSFSLSTLVMAKVMSSIWARSIQPKFQPVRQGKVVHLKRWTRLFKTFPVGPNRSIEFWTEISGNLVEWIAPYVSTLERTVLSPPLTLLKDTLFSHDGVRLHDVCSTSDTIYYTRQMKVK